MWMSPYLVNGYQWLQWCDILCRLHKFLESNDEDEETTLETLRHHVVEWYFLLLVANSLVSAKSRRNPQRGGREYRLFADMEKWSQTCNFAIWKLGGNSPIDIAKKHRLSLVLVGLFSLATNWSLARVPYGSLFLVTVGREDRRGPMKTDVFGNIIWAIEALCVNALPLGGAFSLSLAGALTKKIS